MSFDNCVQFDGHVWTTKVQISDFLQYSYRFAIDNRSSRGQRSGVGFTTVLPLCQYTAIGPLVANLLWYQYSSLHS